MKPYLLLLLLALLPAVAWIAENGRESKTPENAPTRSSGEQPGVNRLARKAPRPDPIGATDSEPPSKTEAKNERAVTPVSASTHDQTP
ncbi:MAG: hypothetical protein ABIS43_17450 [Opitutus sp.]